MLPRPARFIMSLSSPTSRQHAQSRLILNTPIESIATHCDFRRLSAIDGVDVELRYATTNNFVGRNMYDGYDCAWLHNDAATALTNVAANLQRTHPHLRLLVLDALRPQRVQELMWQSLDGTDLQQYLAPPDRGSIHSFGMAVDVTLVQSSGVELDMGTPFDDLSEHSHPALEAKLLASGAITVAQIANRQILRDAMFANAWKGISTEWWHFDCGDRALVRKTYTRVL
jgi:D-alanyl-D-alanine dipeptidase